MSEEIKLENDWPPARRAAVEIAETWRNVLSARERARLAKRYQEIIETEFSDDPYRLRRPKSLTEDRAYSVLPQLSTNPEWKKKQEAGELPEGIMGMAGSMDIIWPEAKLTIAEAEYIKWMSEQGSMRWLADEIFGDSNQIYGMHIIEAADRVLNSDDKENKGNNTG